MLPLFNVEYGVGFTIILSKTHLLVVCTASDTFSPMQALPVFSVPEKPALTFLSKTGRFSHQPHRPGMQLKDSVTDAFELLSGKAYSAATSSMPLSSASLMPPKPPDNVGIEPQQLMSRIRTELQRMPHEDLATLAADDMAFEERLQEWLAETSMGQRYSSAKARVTQLALENTELHEVRFQPHY
jgi:hypothetical protein